MRALRHRQRPCHTDRMPGKRSVRESACVRMGAGVGSGSAPFAVGRRSFCAAGVGEPYAARLLFRQENGIQTDRAVPARQMPGGLRPHKAKPDGAARQRGTTWFPVSKPLRASRKKHALCVKNASQMAPALKRACGRWPSLAFRSRMQKCRVRNSAFTSGYAFPPHGRKRAGMPGAKKAPALPKKDGGCCRL